MSEIQTAFDRVHFNEYGDYLDKPYVVKALKSFDVNKVGGGRMREFIVSVPDEKATLFIDRFGIDGTKMFGHELTGEVVRCRDCRWFTPECEYQEELEHGVFETFVEPSDCGNPERCSHSYDFASKKMVPVHIVTQPDGFCTTWPSTARRRAVACSSRSGRSMPSRASERPSETSLLTIATPNPNRARVARRSEPADRAGGGASGAGAPTPETATGIPRPSACSRRGGAESGRKNDDRPEAQLRHAPLRGHAEWIQHSEIQVG